MYSEGVRVYKIPDESRNDYFDFVDDFKKRIRNVSEENWNTYNDPLIQIDMSTFSRPACLLIEIAMNRLKAIDVTESLDN